MQSSTPYASINIDTAFEQCQSTLTTIREKRRAAAAAAAPPDSNTGGNPPGSKAATAFDLGLATIDTLTFTLPLVALSRSPLVSVLSDSDFIASAISATFLEPLGFWVGDPTGKRINGYKQSCPIVLPGDDGSNGDTNYGYVAFGGNCNKSGDDTACIYLTGQACESINLADADTGGRVWAGIAATLELYAAKITRLDVAYDDLTGQFGGVGAAVGWYEAGAFRANGVGVMPSVCQHGDWINGHSRTLELGKRDNGKLLRIYEKGHQLGAEVSPWVRYELELRSRDRVIPYAALLDPSGILAGSSPAMEMVMLDATPRPVKTIVKQRLTVTIEHLTHYARIAYGRLFNAMESIGLDSAAILDSLRLEGLPRRLYIPPAVYAPVSDFV